MQLLSGCSIGSQLVSTTQPYKSTLMFECKDTGSRGYKLVERHGRAFDLELLQRLRPWYRVSEARGIRLCIQGPRLRETRETDFHQMNK